MATALAKIIANHGPAKLVMHNAAELVIAPFSETTRQDYHRMWPSIVLSAIPLAQAPLHPMARAGGRSFTVSGATASSRGGARFSAFACAKFALQGLTQSLARECQPAGVHLSHVILTGLIETPRPRSTTSTHQR